MPSMRLVCLANSYKTNGRCIAGRERRNGAWANWVRPVSGRTTRELCALEYQYLDGTEPKTLDVIDIPILKAKPWGHQTENYLIGNGPWRKAGTLMRGRLDKIQDKPESLWVNQDSSTLGRFDRVHPTEAATLTESLYLIQAQNFDLSIGLDSRNRRKLRGNFEYGGTEYNLSITDPELRNGFAERDNGSYRLDHVYLCVSLTEPYELDHKCYKVIATVFHQ